MDKKEMFSYAMAKINRREILGTLPHYRCPACGNGAAFTQREVSITNWKYDVKKARWKFEFLEVVDEYGYNDKDMVDPDIADNHVHYEHCDEPVMMPDGSVLKATEMGEWLAHLGFRWKKQEEEPRVLLDQLKKAQESLNPVGTIAELEAKIKALETVS